MPEVPPVKPRLYAASWKMKKIAIVTTTNVCRRVRSATSPTGIAISPGDESAERQQDEHRPAAGDVPVVRRQRDRVAAGAEEHRVAERQVAGVAAEDVPARGGDHEDHREDRDRGRRRVADT